MQQKWVQGETPKHASESSASCQEKKSVSRYSQISATDAKPKTGYIESIAISSKEQSSMVPLANYGNRG